MEGVIPPRGLQPRGFLTQKIMKKRRDWKINCFILIYFRKLNKIHQNVQRFSLNTFGETTSPLSRKSINCSSVIAFQIHSNSLRLYFCQTEITCRKSR